MHTGSVNIENGNGAGFKKLLFGPTLQEVR